MEQLSGLDALFLALETRTTTGHVGGVIILDPRTAAEPLTFARFSELMAQRLPLVPLLRRRLVNVPLGLDQPYWIEDPDFDLEFHLRELGLPSPGSDRQLVDLIGRLHSQPLDLRRPLWQNYLISGLSGDRLAVYTKIHHCAIDGASGNELLTALLDLTPEGRPAPPDNWQPEQVPNDAELMARAALSFGAQPWRAVRFARGLFGAAPAIGSVAKPYANRFLDSVLGREDVGDGGVLTGTSLLPPRTPFNQTITAHRRWAFRTISLDDVKDIKNAYGVTVNDVVMAISAGALRRWLIDRDALPTVPLVSMVPVSLRNSGEPASGSNKVSSMFVVLPTNLADPVARLRVSHEATMLAKKQHMAMPHGLVADVTDFMVPGLMGRAARVSMSLGVAQRMSNIVISNVPGPNIPIYMAGAQMIGYYPVSTLPDGLGLNITVLGYLGGLHFGLIACRELVPDVDDIAQHLVTELELLKATLPTLAPTESAV
jgi:diacylglycerol O-acyltransferase / wax synthase